MSESPNDRLRRTLTIFEQILGSEVPLGGTHPAEWTDAEVDEVRALLREGRDLEAQRVMVGLMTGSSS